MNHSGQASLPFSGQKNNNLLNPKYLIGACQYSPDCCLYFKSHFLHLSPEENYGTASPAPEVGDDAMYVETISQPHVIFSTWPILIDVFAENYENTPDKNTMISLATRVQEILIEAN